MNGLCVLPSVAIFWAMSVAGVAVDHSGICNTVQLVRVYDYYTEPVGVYAYAYLLGSNDVIGFQKMCGLTHDGIVGPATWKALTQHRPDLRLERDQDCGSVCGTVLTNINRNTIGLLYVNNTERRTVVMPRMQESFTGITYRLELSGRTCTQQGGLQKYGYLTLDKSFSSVVVEPFGTNVFQWEFEDDQIKGEAWILFQCICLTSDGRVFKLKSNELSLRAGGVGLELTSDKAE